MRPAPDRLNCPGLFHNPYRRLKAESAFLKASSKRLPAPTATSFSTSRLLPRPGQTTQTTRYTLRAVDGDTPFRDLYRYQDRLPVFMAELMMQPPVLHPCPRPCGRGLQVRRVALQDRSTHPLVRQPESIEGIVEDHLDSSVHTVSRLGTHREISRRASGKHNQDSDYAQRPHSLSPS